MIRLLIDQAKMKEEQEQTKCLEKGNIKILQMQLPAIKKK